MLLHRSGGLSRFEDGGGGEHRGEEGRAVGDDGRPRGEHQLHVPLRKFHLSTTILIQSNIQEDGSMLVTGSEDATARLWATRTEETECLGVLKYPLKKHMQHILTRYPLIKPFKICPSGATARISTVWQCTTHL